MKMEDGRYLSCLMLGFKRICKTISQYLVDACIVVAQISSKALPTEEQFMGFPQLNQFMMTQCPAEKTCGCPPVMQV
jgi:hypothetical protein